MLANFQTSRRCVLLLSLLAPVAAATGCSVGTGNMLTLFPEREQLTETARNIRNITASQGIPRVPRELNESVLPAYTVAPGDTLLVRPADLASEIVFLPDQPVLADGTIHLGKYGQVVVAGKTVPQIEALVRARVNAHHKKDMGPVVAQITVPNSKVYYVLGEVNSPGSFPLIGKEKVLDGILTAGGLNGRASHHSIILSRPTPPNGCRIVLPVCYNQIVQLGDTTTNYQLRPGDRIYVASRSFMENLFQQHHTPGLCNRPQEACIVGCAHGPEQQGMIEMVSTPAKVLPPGHPSLPQGNLVP